MNTAQLIALAALMLACAAATMALFRLMVGAWLRGGLWTLVTALSAWVFAWLVGVWP